MSQERARIDVLHPTLCSETAKDGTPGHWWAGGEYHGTNQGVAR